MKKIEYVWKYMNSMYQTKSIDAHLNSLFLKIQERDASSQAHILLIPFVL